MLVKKSYYLRKIYSWLLPYHCVLCHQAAKRPQDLCQSCYHELPFLDKGCIKCAKPLTAASLICGACLQYPPPFQATFAGFLYEPPITQLLTDLKFRQKLFHARILGELMSERIRTEWYKNIPLPSLIIPMPLHIMRLKERGFNQALEIARPISKILQIPLDYRSCERHKHTAPQTTLSEADRVQNIKQAFRVNRPLTAHHVAVIDDIVTTGYTIREFCKILKQSGVLHIDVWCCARPMMKLEAYA